MMKPRKPNASAQRAAAPRAAGISKQRAAAPSPAAMPKPKIKASARPAAAGTGTGMMNSLKKRIKPKVNQKPMKVPGVAQKPQHPMTRPAPNAQRPLAAGSSTQVKRISPTTVRNQPNTAARMAERPKGAMPPKRAPHPALSPRRPAKKGKPVIDF